MDLRLGSLLGRDVVVEVLAEVELPQGRVLSLDLGERGDPLAPWPRQRDAQARVEQVNLILLAEHTTCPVARWLLRSAGQPQQAAIMAELRDQAEEEHGPRQRRAEAAPQYQLRRQHALVCHVGLDPIQPD